MSSSLSKKSGKIGEQECNKECPEREKWMNILNLALDGEATEEQEKYLKSHVDMCLPCLNDYNLEKTIKELLQSNCSKAEVPAGLMETIKSKLNEKTV